MALQRVTISMSGKDAVLIAALIKTGLNAASRTPEAKVDKANKIAEEMFNQANGR